MERICWSIHFHDSSLRYKPHNKAVGTAVLIAAFANKAARGGKPGGMILHARDEAAQHAAADTAYCSSFLR